MFHFIKMREKYPNLSRQKFQSQTGYTTFYYEKSTLRSIANIHTMTTVDINHDIKNKAQQLDNCIKHTKLAHVRLFVHFIPSFN